MNTITNHRIHYVTAVSSPEEAKQCKLMIESLRKFGEEIGACPLWLFLTDMKLAGDFSELKDTNIFPLEVEALFRPFPLSEKVFACAQAEELVGSEVRSLVWVNPDCLIFNPPELFALEKDFEAAFRPVHIKNVGSLANEPLDGFWLSVYEEVGVREVPYTLESYVDAQTIRPYFNTHCFSIDPAKGIMHAWRAFFKSILLNREFQTNYCQDALHQIFLHQVILSALVMKVIEQKRILMLPPEYSYPLHLQDQLPEPKRIKSLNQLVCMVYEDTALLDSVEIEEPIRSWLETKRLRA